MEQKITTRQLEGHALTPWLAELAALRIKVFRDFPYLYDGTLDYEKRYLATYLKSPESIIMLVFDGETMVGACTGLPLEDETDEFQRPFLEQGYDSKRVFYCAESVLLKKYRGKGLYKDFFAVREGQARSLKRFDWCAFCSVERPNDHPLRPSSHIPLDAIWKYFGYSRHAELRATYHWKDIDRDQETAHSMVFWLKAIKKEE